MQRAKRHLPQSFLGEEEKKITFFLNRAQEQKKGYGRNFGCLESELFLKLVFYHRPDPASGTKHGTQ